MSLLSGFASKEKKKQKSTSAAVKLDCDPAIDAWTKAHDDKKDAESRMAEAEAKILPLAEKARLDESMRNREHTSSIKINDKITMVVQNRYSTINMAEKPSIDSVFGEEDAKRYFKVKQTVEFTQKALNDEQLIKQLLNLVGDKFEDYFTVTEEMVPTPMLHEGRSTDMVVASKANKLIDAGILKPYKPSFKVG